MTPFETKAGTPSEDDMIMQLVEKLRESTDLAYGISHLNNAKNRTDRGAGFGQFGKRFEQAAKLVLSFANQSGRIQ